MMESADTRVRTASFKCQVCGQSFPKKTNLGVHQRNEHGICSIRLPRKSNSYTCRICAKVIKGVGPYVLRLHIQTHDAKTPFKCDLCDKNFKTDRNLAMHQRTHRENREKYKCEVCSQECSTAYALQQHVIRAHVVDKEFQCSICDNLFLTEIELERHRKQRHENIFQCDVCPKSFRSTGYLLKHLRATHSRTKLCTICLKSFPGPQEYQHHLNEDDTSDKDPIVCGNPGCSLEFTTLCVAYQHLAEIHKPKVRASTESKPADEETKYSCKFCEKSFKSERDLRSHENHVHKECSNKEWRCGVCNKTFKSKGILKGHKKYTHTTERNYKCEICLKLYKTKGNLIKHVKSHDTDKPHKCSKCPNSYNFPCHLRKHLEAAHGVV